MTPADYPFCAEQASTWLDQWPKDALWSERLRVLVSWGQMLPALRADQGCSVQQLGGCEVPILASCQYRGGCCWFSVHSPSRVVNGLLACLLLGINGQSPQAVVSFDLENYFAALGLAQQLTPSRTNGLRAVYAHLCTMATPWLGDSVC